MEFDKESVSLIRRRRKKNNVRNKTAKSKKKLELKTGSIGEYF